MFVYEELYNFCILILKNSSLRLYKLMIAIEEQVAGCSVGWERVAWVDSGINS